MENNSSARPHRENMMALSPNYSIIIFFYYAVLMVVSAVYSFNIFEEKAGEGRQLALEFCIGFALTGSVVFYSRKLYKACINKSYDFESNSKIQKIGTFFYFVLRPAFAAIFAWVTHMIWEATIITSVDRFSGFSETHMYFSGILGFFVGFLAGRVLSRMEAVGEMHLKGVW